jgi:hypothetical protein
MPEQSALTPEEAVRRWCDPAAIKAMDGLSYYAERLPYWILGAPPTHDQLMHDRYCKIRQPLEEFVVFQLRNGRWTATALQSPVTLQSERLRVPAKFWDFLKLDFKAATAEGKRLELVEVKIELAPSGQSERSGPPAIESPGPQHRESRSPSGADQLLHLSDDNAILSLFGEKLIFRGKIQQSILRQLVDAYRDDGRLRTSEILRRAGSDVDSIAKAFRNNRHWPLLQKIIRQDQGFVWLDLSAPP